MFKLANAAAVGGSGGTQYAEMATYFASVLGSDHPMLRRYVLRHTAASNLLLACMDAVTTAAILGHTDVKMLPHVYGP